ncbi:MAG TPA: xanthine dehydrogenase family protein subunit M [Syntrophorhabdales bacterium]|nr:xanthine dehydrogenase family protein subunit M [Syntrophorhabdales bacterium]
MKPFDYYKATTVQQAVDLLAKYQDKAAILAGGSDLLGLMKDRIEGPKMKLPQHVVDIKGIKDLAIIREQKTSLRIGAAVTITSIISSEVVAAKYPLLVQAAKQVAVPQIRNVGTLGGNLCQRPRCWYFRGKLFTECLRKGGGNCYAHDGENQYHAIIGGDICAMVYPSDMAPALIALDAKAEIAGPKGSRTVPLEKFYVSPEKVIVRENVLAPQEMLVAVEIPASSQGRKGVFLKLKERQAFDFAIVSVAVSLASKGTILSDARIAFGGVAPFPLRSAKAEAALKGKELKGAVSAACAVCVDGAQPMSKNGYKVDAAKGVLEQALTSLA